MTRQLMHPSLYKNKSHCFQTGWSDNCLCMKSVSNHTSWVANFCCIHAFFACFLLRNPEFSNMLKGLLSDGAMRTSVSLWIQFEISTYLHRRHKTDSGTLRWLRVCQHRDRRHIKFKQTNILLFGNSPKPVLMYMGSTIYITILLYSIM